MNIGLNFWMIPKWGILGAGWSTVIGYSVLVVLGWRNAQRSYPVSYDFSRVLRVAAVAAVFMAALVEVVPAVGWVGIPARVALVAAFPLALMAVGVVTPGERKRIAALLARSGRRGAAAGRPSSRSSRSSASPRRRRSSGAAPQRSSLMRIRLPAGSRKAQSRIPYGCSIGSWTTSAPLACSRSKVPSRSLVARTTMA